MRARTTVPPFAMTLFAAALLACGCNPRFTRLPNPGPLPPVNIEGPSQERFDPFAADDIGPETFTRPPDYQNARPDARARFPAGVRRPPASQGPLNPFPGLGGLYPDAVR